MKIKGVVLLSRKEFVIEHFGEQGWEKVLHALPPENEALLRGNVLSSNWFPFDIGKRVDEAVVSVLGRGKESLFEELGVKSAQRSLTKEHKTFLAPGNPQGFLKKSPTIYKFYYDSGYRQYKETGSTSGEMTTYEAESYSVPDCLTVVGWHKEALKMCGAKDVECIEVECRAKGGSCCRYQFKWRM